MTSKTRRFVFFSVLAVALTLPAETILLRALVTPEPQMAVREWVADLDQTELSVAASRIQGYPLQYRREIMRALTPEGRSRVWRGHLQTYLRAHPELGDANADLIRTASAVLSPGFFGDSDKDARASLHAVADQIVAALGRGEAEYLLYALGPRDGTFASFEPMAMYLSNKVRGAFIAAADTPVCNCAMYFGCYDWSTNCSQELACSIDNSWPACGWGWNDPCDGVCLVGW